METWLLVIFTAFSTADARPHYIQFSSEVDCKAAFQAMTSGMAGMGRTVWCFKGGVPIKADEPVFAVRRSHEAGKRE
jgi:hypothetical protein